MKIVVSGSLGNTGKPLAEQLIRKGHSVTVISSDEKKKNAIGALGATAAIGSLEDEDFLSGACEGAEAIYVMFPPNYSEPDPIAYYARLANHYAKAIRQSKIKRVVHLSSYGAHLDKGTGFILGSHRAEEILNELEGINITHLRPGYFYYNLYAFTDMIRSQGIIGANYGGDDLMVMAHPLDIAEAASEELVSTNSGIKVRYVVSDERTASDVARVLGTAIGKPELQWLTFTDNQMLEGMVHNGVPAHVAANFVEMGASTHSGILKGDYERHKPVKHGKVKVEDFAKEFAVVYNQ